MNRCEDYPCCGHTNDDPCGPQWYDAPNAFDLRTNPHAFCDHSEGWCEAEEEEPEVDDDFPMSMEYPMEDQWLDGSYEE